MEKGMSYWKERSIQISEQDSGEELIRKSTLLRPSVSQKDWQKIGFSVFFHFGMNTFTNREWGLGDENPSFFNPTNLNAEQWVYTAKEAGAGLAILTCKHHDGFCLWPSKYTEHSVKNSPWKDGKGDVVREFSDACRKYGMKFGVYYSPWDRHEKTYGTGQAYNQFYKNQLTELLTEYGEVTELWFDGACGEAENGKKQEYDWIGFWSLARQLQPKIMLTGVAPDARWCGNEDGACRLEEWAQTFIPMKNEVSEKNKDKIFSLSIVNHNLLGECQKQDLTSKDAFLHNYAGQKGWLMWYPPMVDTSIRPGWFYHEEEDSMVRTPGNLIDLYIRSTGGNAMLLLNIPPDKRGLVHENDVKNLKLMGEYIKRVFSINLAESAEASADSTKAGSVKSLFSEKGYWRSEKDIAEITLKLQKRQEINFICLREFIENGQSIELFEVKAYCPYGGWQGSEDGEWRTIGSGTTIGARKILSLPRTICSQVKISILKARSGIELEKVSLHCD